VLDQLLEPLKETEFSAVGGLMILSQLKCGTGNKGGQARGQDSVKIRRFSGSTALIGQEQRRRRDASSCAE
tara:strand:+ start:5396 stop:5608 length:213 start_codon:yes stop_codon:yes gene_type:complete